MNEMGAHAALALGPAATRRFAHSARPDAPVLPEDPRWEVRRRRRRERTSVRRLRKTAGERRDARAGELGERDPAAGEREDQRVGRSGDLGPVAGGPGHVGGDEP